MLKAPRGEGPIGGDGCGVVTDGGDGCAVLTEQMVVKCHGIFNVIWYQFCLIYLQNTKFRWHLRLSLARRYSGTSDG